MTIDKSNRNNFHSYIKKRKIKVLQMRKKNYKSTISIISFQIMKLNISNPLKRNKDRIKCLTKNKACNNIQNQI